ncbi:MAG: phage holin family protein [Solirubrobacterales bacterium]|nr:phage holin family protein [Solirubrobacterales bacterium]MBV9944535.1 phage holin family protein [Solirubrobacterales bacterium]
MSVPGIDQVGERPLEELVQNASQQAVLLAREQVDIARQELTARGRQALPGVALVGGGALLAALASGAGTAGLILLLARRRGASAAALGVTGAYAGASAVLARAGLVRLREAGPHRPDVPDQDEPVQDAEQDVGPARRPTKPAAKSSRQARSAAKLPRQTKSVAKSPRQAKSAGKLTTSGAGRPKPASRTPSSRRRPAGSPTARTRRRAP